MSPLAAKFHLLPYKLFHRKPSSEEERIFSEVYDSNVFQAEHDKVQQAPLPDDDLTCSRPRVVASMMCWSDSTHLTSFGNAKLWPIYLSLGNLSKYIRVQPTSGAFMHLAYIPSLSDSFQDFVSTFHQK
jgi:hypothetical protein